MSLSGVQRLFEACHKGDIATAKECLKNGVHVDSRDPQDGDGRTPLHLASHLGKAELAELLLHSGATVDAKDKNGNTPLILASYSDDHDTVTILLEKGADPNLQDKDGCTALIAACEQGHCRMARILLEAGVEISKKKKDTLLRQAIYKGYLDLAKLLLEKGAHTNVEEEDDTAVLINACREGHGETARILIEAGANISKTDQNDDTALYEACRKALREVVMLLLEANAAINMKNKDGKTPLILASCSGDQDTVQILLEKGADPIMQDKLNKTALHYASERGEMEVTQLLLERGAAIDAKDKDGKTPLILSIYHGHHNTAKSLLEKGANPNLQDKCNKTALHYASEKGMVEMVHVLLQKGAVVDAKDDDGTTVLIDTCRQGHDETARFLVEAGADINKKNQYGWTALSVSSVRDKEMITAAVLRRRDHHTDPNYPYIHFYSKPFKAVVTSEGQNVAFDDIGVTMTVPPGAVPEDTQLDVTVRPCLSGPFILPEGYQPVSPPYLITASCHLTLEVKMSIEHFAELRQEEDSKSLVFLRANSKCSNRKYKFEEVPREKFSFTVGKRTGVVSLKDFSLYWIVRAISALIWGENAYSLRLYRSPNPSPDEVKAFFCVTLMQQLYIKNLETEVRSQFPSFHEVTVEEPVYLYEERMTVDIPSRVKGWSVEYDRSPVVTRDQMDLPLSNPDYTQFSRYPPKFHLRVLPTLEEHNQMCATSCSFSVKGLEEAHEFTLFLPRNLTTPAGTSVAFEMSPDVEQDNHITEINGSTYAPLGEDVLPILLNQLQNAASKWRDVGVYLGFGSGALDNIQSKPSLYTEGAPGFLRELLIQWLKWAPPDHPGPTVGNLVSALRRAREGKMALELQQELLLSSTAQFSDAPLPGVRPKNIEAYLQVQKALESTIVSNEPNISSLRQAGEKLLRQFDGACDELWEWLRDALRKLDEAEPITGNTEFVAAQLAKHKDLQKQLGAQMSTCSAVMKAGQQLIKQITGHDKDVLKKKLEELEQEWERVCQLLMERQERLQQAYQHLEQFRSHLRLLQSWMTKVLSILDESEPIQGDIDFVDSLIAGHASFQKDLDSNQKNIDTVNTIGDHLVTKVLDDPTVICQNLQELNEMWEYISQQSVRKQEKLDSAYKSAKQFEGTHMDSQNGKLQIQSPTDEDKTDELKALSEDVTSIQHEFDEDMLEKLWRWVGEAEAKMAETETTSIGSDLEVVEQQLAEHEEFQKEKASRQPSIDALNKANKSKAAHPHANPEITKRINSLFEHWQKLSVQSSAIHQVLLDAHTRLNNIALARSFNFEAWKKQFLDWAHQRKLKVVDCFRKFDNDNDGMLTTEEFMKGLKASGMAMNQVELKMTADAFDRDHDGLINLNEIMPILKGTHRPRGEDMSDDEKIEHEIQHEISKCTCPMSFKVARVGDGQYQFGDFRRLYLVQIPRCTVTVRVGGGFVPLADFLHKYDPCRAKSTAMKTTSKKTKKLRPQPEPSTEEEKRPAGQQRQHVISSESPAVGQQRRHECSPITQPHSPGFPAGDGVKASHSPTPKK